jgi:hypothetical protein
MQVLQAGDRKLLLLEPEVAIVEGIAQQLGFEVRQLDESPRVVTMELHATDRQSNLLLFDASDPGNLGWFSRCQFYVDGRSGAVMQTPIRVANVRDRSNHLQGRAIRLQLEKELPTRFRVPGRQPVSEQAIYAIIYNLLSALLEVGVAVCGSGVVKPLAGRGEGPRGRG